jgi:hypothetical protein
LNISSKKAWAGALGAGVAGVLGFTALTASAPADTERRGDPTISMEFDGMSAPRFEGPSTIFEGQSLRILNNSDPMEIGPHTFSMVEKRFLPENKQEIKDCFKAQSKVCKRIFRAHDVDFQAETVDKPLVDKGAEGWDTSFTARKSGDSWFSLDQNEEITQAVPLSAGEKFFYFCVIHPDMQGKLKVVATR